MTESEILNGVIAGLVEGRAYVAKVHEAEIAMRDAEIAKLRAQIEAQEKRMT